MELMNKLKIRNFSDLNYHIVASTNTCYCSENQIFCFLKSQIVTCQFFCLGKYFFYAVKTLCVCQVAGISKRLDNFYFLTPHFTN